MPRFARIALSTFATLFVSANAVAQISNPTSVPDPQGAVLSRDGDIFFYKITAVRRDIDCINYIHRSHSTDIGFIGTNLLPDAKGHASVKSEKGQISIDADFKGLTPANGFGTEFLTYVLWAISPDGRPNNLGEILPDGTKDSIHVTTALQSFGLIVTAEPYFSVSTPSDLVVLKNVVTNDTNGVIDTVSAQAELLPHGFYAAETNGSKTVWNPITRDEKSPLELYEAYNALRIAQNAGAQTDSPSIYAKANEDLTNAASMDNDKHRDKKLEITFAREAVERAEDARVNALRKQAAQRQADAQQAALTSQQEALAAQQKAAQSQADAQAAQLKTEQANLASQQALLAKQQADAARATAEAQAAKAEAQAAAANQTAQAAAQSADEAREKLRAQLNSVLATTETARGIIVNMSDVLFESGKFTLKPATQVALAKVAGILESYPGLSVQVEGYTDSVGGDTYNQTLSENRANAVMNFLVAQGVKQSSTTAKGFGKNDPVADNGTAAGRSLNRRVNLVVTGSAIGVQTTPAANNP